jgi:hypothetical protein
MMKSLRGYISDPKGKPGTPGVAGSCRWLNPSQYVENAYDPF